MNKKGDAWATVSQDYDALLFGAPRLIRNLTISGRRKLPGKPVYVDMEPEMMRLEDVLKELKVTREQLIDIGILLGTDFNPDGFKGIGPKKGYKIIQEYGTLKKALEAKRIEADSMLDIYAITEIFLRPQTISDYHLRWGEMDRGKVKETLVQEFDFSMERIDTALERVEKTRKEQGRQSNLEKWF
jgi:flap endonuclease-1